jgi:hypothetical protein
MACRAPDAWLREFVRAGIHGEKNITAAPDFDTAALKVH